MVQTLLIGRSWKRTLLRATVLVFACAMFFRYVLIPIKVVGISMEPTFVEGQVTFVNALAYRREKPQRGDVVAIRMTGRKVMLMKRVIGLPGERISIVAGVVHINGEPLQEEYVRFPRAPWKMEENVVNEDRYFVIGDNRSMWSKEDHYMGEALEHRIEGKVLLLF